MIDIIVAAIMLPFLITLLEIVFGFLGALLSIVEAVANHVSDLLGERKENKRKSKPLRDD